MPKCAKCNYIIKKDFLTCNVCNKTYHPGCARAYLGSKTARGCCLASLSNSHQRSSPRTMTEQVYNTPNGMPSGSQTPLFSFPNELILPQQHLQAAAFPGATMSTVPQHQQSATNPASVSSVPQQHLQAAAVLGASASVQPQQYHQAAKIPVSFSSVTQHHPHTATVSDEMSRFNNLDSDAKMSRMYEFMFTHMRVLESRLDEVARTTSERFSQVDARLQALEQREVEQTFRPHESTAEIVVSGLPTRGQLSHQDIISRIFNFVEAARFLDDIISIRKLNSVKENGGSGAPNGDTAVRTSYSLILRFKSVQVRNEVMRLKIVKGNIPVVAIFPDLQDLTEDKVFLNEFLAKEVLKLLRLVRARAKARNYERVWVRNEQIFVRKSSDSDIISIMSESDLNKLI